jgi:hypothetical protein
LTNWGEGTYGIGGKSSRSLSGAKNSVGSGSNGKIPAAAVEAKAIHTSSVYIIEDETLYQNQNDQKVINEVKMQEANQILNCEMKTGTSQTQLLSRQGHDEWARPTIHFG